MEYFLSHVPAIIVAGCIITAAAILWYFLLEKQAKNKRDRINAKKQDKLKENNH